MKKLIFLFSIILLFGVDYGFSTNYKYNPIYGPKEITLSEDIGSVKTPIAEIKIPKGFGFLDKKDTQKLFEEFKEVYSGNEIGIVFPKEASWFAVIRYARTGYIKDEGIDKLDSDKILKIIKEKNQELNKKRKEMGSPTIEIIGWDEPPYYNRNTHTLICSIIGREENKKDLFLNYFSAILGRYGVLTITIVSDYKNASLLHSTADFLTSAINFTQENKYEQWESGDKVSDITIKDLIIGGATGAAVYSAAKAGLFAKLGKILISVLLIFKKAFLLVLISIGLFFRWLWRKLTFKR
jgi:uncharacterized membrane-anchored protein